MVTISNYFERQKNDGSTFIVLELTGGVELIQSSKTNRFYATVRKSTFPFTGSAEIAKTLIGQRVEGEIVKVIVEPYTFINPRTQEEMVLRHSYAYQASDTSELVGHTRVQELSMA